MRFLTRWLAAPVLVMAVACSSSPKAAAVVDGGRDASSSDSTPGNPKPDVTPTSEGGCSPCGEDTGAGPGHDAGHDSPAPQDTGHDTGPPKPVHTTGVSIMVNTVTGPQNRTYDITVPVGCDAAHPMPLVFVFHGDGGNGAGMYAAFPIEAAAAAAGGTAIFVYPDGLDNNIDPGGASRAWDLYHDPGPPPYTYTPGQPVPAESDEPSGNGDIDFFDTMLETFQTKYCVDTSKVFITGMSSGGYLANQFARWRSSVVKGTAPQSGGAPFGNMDSADGTWNGTFFCISSLGSVPALIIHGLSDGTVDPCNAIEAQSYWQLTNSCASSANNCTSTADMCTGSNLAAPSSAPTTPSPLNADCVETTGCAAPVVLCEIPGMGHQIWSEAPQVIWSFFSSL
jgi:polyhydroxybutyrate depolymerase